MGYRVSLTNGSAKIKIDDECNVLLKLRQSYPQCTAVYRTVSAFLENYLDFNTTEDNTGITITGFEGEYNGDSHLENIREFLTGAISWSGEDGAVWVQSFGDVEKYHYNVIASELEAKLIADMGITISEA